MGKVIGKYRACWRVIEANLSDLDIKSLALLYQIKREHTNSRVYNYAPRSLQQKINCSAYLINKFVKNLINKDYAFMDGTTLVIRPLKYISKLELEAIRLKDGFVKNAFYNKVSICKSENIKETTFRLKAVNAEMYLRQQQRVIRAKRDLKYIEGNPKAFIPFKRLKANRLLLKKHDEVVSYETVLSERKAMKRLCINPTDFKPFRVFTAEKFGWLWHPQRKIREACPFEAHDWWCTQETSSIYGYRYYANGESVLHLATSVKIPKSTVSFRSIGLRKELTIEV